MFRKGLNCRDYKKVSGCWGLPGAGDGGGEG